MIDKIFTIAFASAYTAIFEIGSVMALLMLLFGILDYKKGDALRRLQKLGLITLDANGARPTRQGLLFNDDLVAELL